MKRKEFLQLSSLGYLGLTLPSLSISDLLKSNALGYTESEFKPSIEDLLKDWCDGMLTLQIIDKANLEIHGALGCPSCSHIHGRCMDALYPFLYMADKTGESKYLEAAILVMEWAENNVSQADGSWTVIPDPKSWKGITVFGAIALAEALHFHGQVLDKSRYESWTNRLGKAGEYIYDNFTISFTNINYGATAVYGLNIIGEVLNNEKYIRKSKELAEQSKQYFTEYDGLLYGECKPHSDKLSKKGLHGVDLGYNVEESLNNLVLYALKEKDEHFLELLTKSLISHLEFMLPDGAWDNSWGTRQYKWSYWGSRTCDGSQLAYAMMAHYDPAFGTAAFKNTQLLKQCTKDGLLHGGPHFVSHGIKACIHHTFTHAKPLTTLLNHWKGLPEINTKKALPRTMAEGLRYFKDLDVILFSRGNWRGTVSAYDAEYHYQFNYRQASGGALGMLFHQKVGLICTASMAIYKMVEENNQQPAPGKDIALTPRIETFKGEDWYTNLFDLEASLESADNNGIIEVSVDCKLKNELNELVSGTATDFQIRYECSKESIIIAAKSNQEIFEETAFVIPIVSPSVEEVTFVNENEITIKKQNGVVRLRASAPIKVKEISGRRTFNMVPGVEAIPIEIFFDQNSKELYLTLSVD